MFDYVFILLQTKLDLIFRNSVMYRGAVLNTYKYHLRASSCPNIYRNSMTTLAKETEEVQFF